MKEKKLLIFGNSKCASWVKDYFQERSEYEVESFVVDEQYISDNTFCELPVTAAEICSVLYPPNEYFAFVAVGYKDMNRLREEKMRWMRQQGYSLVSYIDPSCSCMASVDIGENCFVMENAVLQPRVRISDGVFIGSGVCIGHDVQIGECSYAALGSVVSGDVIIGRNSFIGANATISNNITLADYTLVGAGAYITKNTAKYGVYLTEHSRNILRKTECSEEAQKQFFG